MRGNGRILAIDYGSKRVGLAVTDPLRIIAQPLVTVASDECLDYIALYVEKNDVGVIIVGMPVQPSGEPSDSQRFVRPFVGRLRARFAALVDIYEVDERFSTVEARRAMIVGGVSKSNRRERSGLVDRTAASIILQAFLENFSL